jgi:Ca-activated chloride channel homolog
MNTQIKTSIPFTLVVLISVLVSTQVLPQSNKSAKDMPPDQKPITFSIKVGLVALPVAVLDKSDGFVPGLEEKDFTVYEDGVPQKLDLFDNKDIPVAIGLIIDNSSSMAPRREEVVEAGLALAENSNPQDEFFVLHFYDRLAFALRLHQAFARNLKIVQEAVASMPGSGKTALYDAVCAGLEHVQQSTLQKKVLVIISDGGDNASKHTLREASDLATSSSSLVYSVGLFDERNKEKKPEILERLATITGGKAYFPQDSSGLPEVCKRIAIDIRSQYTLGFVPSNQNVDGKFRKIRVEVRSPKHDKLTVRTRSGYSVTK